MKKKRLLSIVMALAMIFGFTVWVPDLEAFAASYNGNIYNNGLGGINIDISAYPYNSMNNGTAYASNGCAWFASCRAKQFSDKVNKIWGANNWVNYGSSYGFTVDNTPSAGSIMCWTTGNGGNGHVAFLEKIEGNTAYISEGGCTDYPNNSYCHIYTVSVSSMTSKKDSSRNYMKFGGYVHVGSSGTKPAWAKVTVPKSTFAVGEEITFTLTSDTGKAYTIGIDNSDGERIHTYNWYFGSESTTQYYKYTINKSGNYSCYISAINDIGLCDSERIYFSVATKPSWAKVSLPKSTFNAGEEMTFTLTSDTGKSYTIGIDDSNGNRIHTYNFYFGTESTTQYYKYNIKEPGNYSCYISAINDIGLCDSERIYFSIAGKPLWAKVSVPKSQFIHGEEIDFTLSSDYGKSYTIGIDNEDGKRIHTYNFYFGSGSTTQIYKYKLDKIGEYSCYITAINDIGLCDSDRIYFNVGHNWNNPTYIWSSDYKTCTATRTCANNNSHKETETVNSTYAVTKEPTENADGIGTYTAKFANTAFETRTKIVTIPVLSHTHEWGSPTYSWSSDYKTCTATRVCKKDSSHKETETVNTSYAVATNPTETTDGVGIYTAKLSNSAFATQTKTVAIAAQSHTHSWGEPTYTWSSDYKTCTATRVCTLNSNHIETEKVNSSSAVKTSATCTVKGTTTYTAIFTNKAFANQTKEVQDIAVKGHAWSEWKTTAFDATKGTATQARTCSVCQENKTRTVDNAIQRLAGKGRYATAVEISKAGFPDGSDTVVLAYGLNYADALAGVSLATKLEAPILLTNTKTLDGTTLAEIKRLKAKNVIILGGTGAISTAVENSLKKEGLKTDRIFGASRFGTATAIAEKLTDAPTDVFFVYAFNSADALSVSPIAASKNAPIIYLSTKGDLNADTATYLAKLKMAGCVKNAYVIGGEGVISNDMMKKAGSALGVTPVRVFGANRFETCVAVNERFADVLDGDMLCVATGMDFPDALAGGVYAAINKAPLFLINGKLKTPKLTDEQKAYLKTKAAAKITAFGGVGVVPDNHIADIAKNSI